MTTIKLVLNGEKLIATEKPTISSGDVDTVKVSIQFDANWDGFGKTVVFYVDSNKTYNCVLYSNECVVPHEILENKCTFYMGIRGSSENKVITSTILAYKIVKGTPGGDDVTVEPTAGVYEQLISAYGNMESRLDNAAYCNITDENEFEYNDDVFSEKVLEVALGSTELSDSIGKTTLASRDFRQKVLETIDNSSIFKNKVLQTTLSGGKDYQKSLVDCLYKNILDYIFPVGFTYVSKDPTSVPYESNGDFAWKTTVLNCFADETLKLYVHERMK